MSTASILNDVGVPWPDADTGKARSAAAAWAAIASAAQDALGTAGGAAASLSAHNTGPAMDAFNTFWGGIGGPFEACSVVEKPALLPILIEACNALSTACTNFADAVDEAKSELEDTAAEIATAVTAGAVATIFTLGVSDGISLTVSAGLIGTALGSIEVLGTTVADIVGAMVVGGTFSTVDEILETNFGNAAKAVLGEQLPSAREDGLNLLDAFFVGALTGGVGHLATNAAKTAALAGLVNLPDTASALMPELPGILAQIPDALETPAGIALKTLASEYAAKTVVEGARGKPVEMPTLPEVLGELLNAKIEGSVEPPEEGGE